MCMIDGADGCCTVLLETRPTARKDHRCDECCRTIEKGESYLNERLLWEGEINTHKTCVHCLAVRQWLHKECGGWVYESVKEDLQEHVLEGGYPYALARAAVSMDQYWRNRKGELRPVPDLSPCLTPTPEQRRTA